MAQWRQGGKGKRHRGWGWGMQGTAVGVGRGVLGWHIKAHVSARYVLGHPIWKGGEPVVVALGQHFIADYSYIVLQVLGRSPEISSPFSLRGY